MSKLNKHDIKKFLGSKLKNYKSTLKDTSFDDENNVYLCSDFTTENVFNFDKFIEDNYHEKRPASPDAIYLGVKKLYFIEFKNQIPRKIDSSEIKSKFEKGTNILKELLESFSPRDVEYIFCVVYKGEKKPKHFDYRHITINSIRFGLEELNQSMGNFYNSIITENINFYKKNFEQLRCS